MARRKDFSASDTPEVGDAIARRVEERLYEIVAEELAHGFRRDGLWLRAIVESAGIESEVIRLYTQLRVRSLMDETLIELASANASQITSRECTECGAEFDRRFDETWLLCPACR